MPHINSAVSRQAELENDGPECRDPRILADIAARLGVPLYDPPAPPVQRRTGYDEDSLRAMIRAETAGREHALFERDAAQRRADFAGRKINDLQAQLNALLRGQVGEAA